MDGSNDSENSVIVPFFQLIVKSVGHERSDKFHIKTTNEEDPRFPYFEGNYFDNYFSRSGERKLLVTSCSRRSFGPRVPVFKTALERVFEKISEPEVIELQGIDEMNTVEALRGLQSRKIQLGRDIFETVYSTSSLLRTFADLGYRNLEIGKLTETYIGSDFEVIDYIRARKQPL